MSPLTVLLPVFVQIALTFGLLLWLGSERVRAIQARELHIRDMALGEDVWPKRIKQIDNAFHNQLELPVLFYALVALVFVTGHATLTFVVLSWLFVVFRLLHALIHVTTNNVPRRFWVYNAGLFVLMAMWFWFLVVVAFGA